VNGVLAPGFASTQPAHRAVSLCSAATNPNRVSPRMTPITLIEIQKCRFSVVPVKSVVVHFWEQLSAESRRAGTRGNKI
jgi:hypothetical protein